ncbi:MAG: leucyl/phenylalanyl-tRNA--protein transferase [Deltaproteobacteria bacterium]|nr:leucyl/phenylalanyl-tRNA--protein transferase [Deltaproteobacteria bacterium]
MATRRVVFPHPSPASPDGIVAVGAEPRADVLRDAYRQGIFPWPHEGYPLLWFSPDPRFVLEPKDAHLHRSLKKELKRTTLEIRADTSFREVIEGCAEKRRRGQRGTWITDEMIEGYTALHGEGLAHSIEAWREGKLVGGLYGVSLGRVFFGESMFQLEPDASKIAFATLLANLVTWNFELVDCQSHTEHLERFGAVHWPRDRFLDVLAGLVRAPTRDGRWTLDVPPRDVAAVLEAAQGRSVA